MKNIYYIPFLVFMLVCSHSMGQDKIEREERIKKSEFPEIALAKIEDKLDNARKIRFYKEIYTTKTGYEVKFKKNRLRYSVEFNEKGTLEDIEVLIKAVDIPNDVLADINDYLKKEFSKFRINKIQQQYPVGPNDVDTTIKNAFQNLMIPSLKYELIVTGTKDSDNEQFEILFDSEGNLEFMQKLLPQNYDHILY